MTYDFGLPVLKSDVRSPKSEFKQLGILRVSAKTELKGLDVTEHGQDAYASFQFFSNT